MTDGTKPVIASIGTGMMGQLAHLANYARLRDEGECEVAGVADLKRGLAAAVAERYRVPRVYASTEELLADPRVEAVACVQQWANNYPLVKQALAAGKSVITEKPMVGRLDEAHEAVRPGGGTGQEPDRGGARQRRARGAPRRRRGLQRR